MRSQHAPHQYSLNVGLGDLIVCKSQFLQLDTSQVTVAPNLHIAELYRSKPYKKFVIELMKTIYTEPVFKLELTHSRYLNINWEFFAARGVNPKWYSLEKQLCHGKPLDMEPYVVVNMKVRGMNFNYFNKKLPEIRAALKAIRKVYPLVFIGERKVGMCKEYRELAQVGRLTFSLYKHIKDLVDVDLTIPELGITAPELDDLKQKCVYMRDAEAVVNLGYGGNVLLSSTVSKQTFNLFASTDRVGSLFFLKNHDSHHIFQKAEDFKDGVEDWLATL